MKSLDLNRYAHSACVAAAMLASCGGSQPPITARGEMPQGLAIATQAAHDGSWVPPDGVKFKTLRSFLGPPTDGNNPLASLIEVGGTLFGTTQQGGESYYGTVFKITPTGSETVLHNFAGGADGAFPSASLLKLDDTLYGTTSAGGSYANCGSVGCGTVFKTTKSGAQRVLYVFAGGKDGAYPQAGLIDVNGTLFGTTYGGGIGTGCGVLGCGTVFKVTRSGIERVLYSFRGGSDGANPGAELIEVNGMFYGTTFSGGVNGNGTVFKVSRSGKEDILYRFAGGSDGANPDSTLLAVNRTLYGTTIEGGGSFDYGTIYKVTTSGKESVLHSFTGGSDGANPRAALVRVKGALYGTTPIGGTGGGCERGCGTIYKISSSGKKLVLYSFGFNQGAGPYAGLLAIGRTLYGTAWYGGPGPGSTGDGAVFAL